MTIEDDDAFGGGGQMGVLMRAFDWSRSALGAAAQWPQSLQSVLGICLGSRFPIAVYWGSRLSLLYNDAWSPILGSKHPWALGRDAAEVWPEIWENIGPLFEQVRSTGESTYSQDALLPMHRHGYTEECYFNFTFTPVRGAGRRVEGVFNAVIETTFRVVSERRVRVLRDLAERLGGARSKEDVCRSAIDAFQAAVFDVPFCILYLRDGDRCVRAAVTGLDEGGPASAPIIDMARTDESWPLAVAERANRVLVVQELADRFGMSFPGGGWPEPADTAFLAPLQPAGKSLGFMVLGKNPRRAFDDEYRQFVDRASSLVSTALANVSALEEERRRAEALAELDRAKTTFFANVSHEFRTPLTLMIGPTEDALASPDRALTGEGLDTVYRNELRLLKLVNSLLEFSRIEAGRVQAAFEPTDLSALTRDLAGMFRSTIERGGLAMEVDCPELPLTAWVDRGMWEKVVLNLLSNAFKFTFRGSVSVCLRQQDAFAQLEVIDTGIGIAASELPRVFERFHRIEGARGRTHEGTGIGLALVRDLVELHAGTVSASSEVGVGTSFTIRIPLGREHGSSPRIGLATGARPTQTTESYVVEAQRWLPERAELPAPTPSSNDVVEGRLRGTVLVADDNADMLQYLARVMKDNFAVLTAVNGAEALALARDKRPDLVVTDVMMPELDGFALLRELRRDPRTSQIPVIMLSARAGEESRIEGLQAGADDYLVKPFGARELVARVSTHLHLARMRAAAEDASRAKDEFLAMLGHELRNPLAPIVTALQLMRMRGQETREQEIIERQVGHLIRLVDDLLDISRITRGKVELRKEEVELASVVLRGVEIAMPLVEQRRQRLDVSVPPQGLLVYGDADRLSQVVSNLLTNASKYSEPDTAIRLSGERVGDKVRMRLVDQGIGLPPDMLERVFDLFVQQPQSLDRSKGGLGLGLAIVRSLVNLHGGVVYAKSEGVGKGAEFVIELPAADLSVKPSDSSGSPGPADADPGQLHQILLVDDNQDAAESIGELLRSVGHQVHTAHDGPSAMALARTFHPTVCILDLGLPVMDGFELAARLRASGDLAEGCRVIALTGYGQDADRRRSAGAGFDGHLVKPVSAEALMKTFRV